MFLKVKITDNANSLIKLAETKFFKVGLVTPQGHHVMPHVEVRTRAQASHRNITVLSHLKLVST